MKLLPEVPTQEMIDAVDTLVYKVFPSNPVSDQYTDDEVTRQIYQAMYAAAPDVKDAPVAYARTFNGEIMVDGLTLFYDAADRELQMINAEYPRDADKREVIPLYAHPSPRIAELEAEVAKLLGALREIGDFAHDKSMGPTIPDALWCVRNMAYEALK